MGKTIIVAGLVAVVILTECLFAYLLIPSRGDLEKWSAEKAAKEASDRATALDQVHRVDTLTDGWRRVP